MSKTRAYTSQTGSTQVTARQVDEQRKKFFNGAPTPYPYFSIDKPGNRASVKHVSGKSYPYFSYIGSGSGGGAGGESLNHQLFKEALYELKILRLDIFLHVGNGIRKKESIELEVIKAEKEKEIHLAGGSKRYSDIYYQFNSASRLFKKWGGELHIEILNSNATGALKQMDMRKTSTAVIEIEIPPIFQYKIADEDTTDELEKSHREKVKRILQGEKGFLKGVSLSNPSTKDYLIERVNYLKQREASCLLENERLKSELFDAEQKLAAEISKISKISSEASLLRNKLESVSREKDITDSNLKESVSRCSQLVAENHKLMKNIRLWSVFVVSAFFVVIALVVFFLNAKR